MSACPNHFFCLFMIKPQFVRIERFDFVSSEFGDFGSKHIISSEINQIWMRTPSGSVFSSMDLGLFMAMMQNYMDIHVVIGELTKMKEKALNDTSSILDWQLSHGFPRNRVL
eukprot:TRINITY_DN45720_c0_g1_i1.p1 TRINITY_DN45720_c0_g1~~TRINITY_DN45720_c0_g1_i1.p1  ORF type:complete len:112 (+),score=10.05 TRINITY_DN45720_c0_g1_i1:463-798(+)